MKQGTIMLSVGLLMIIFSLLSLILVSNFSDDGVKRVDCYDRYGNGIIGVTCLDDGQDDFLVMIFSLVLVFGIILISISLSLKVMGLDS